MRKGTYVSGDELERMGAKKRGYHTVCRHPNEIADPKPGETLVIDFDHILFGDVDKAVTKATAAALHGMLVGFHTYYPEDPRLTALLDLSSVVVANTHRQVLAALRRRAARQSGQPTSVRNRPDFKEND
jgi:hypothetical protein